MENAEEFAVSINNASTRCASVNVRSFRFVYSSKNGPSSLASLVSSFFSSYGFATLVTKTQLSSAASARTVTRSPPTEGSKWATVLEPVSNRLRVSALPRPHRPSLILYPPPAYYSTFRTSLSLVRFFSLLFVTFSHHLAFSLSPSSPLSLNVSSSRSLSHSFSVLPSCPPSHSLSFFFSLASVLRTQARNITHVIVTKMCTRVSPVVGAPYEANQRRMNQDGSTDE